MRNVISKDRAREIAASWHGGQWSNLYQFTSSGVYIPSKHLHYLNEILRNLQPEYYSAKGDVWCKQKDAIELNALKRWFIFKGTEHGIITKFHPHPVYGYVMPFVAEGSPDVERLKVPI